jgi:hypothetical protein
LQGRNARDNDRANVRQQAHDTVIKVEADNRRASFVASGNGVRPRIVAEYFQVGTLE